MNTATALATPKPPKQKRSRDRVAKIRKAGEKIILEESLDACTIAALAKATGYPRTTIYMFYPAPLALFNDLAAHHLQSVQKAILEQGSFIAAGGDWQEALSRVIHVVAEYSRQYPVACKLILGPLTDASHRAWEATITNLGGMLQAMLKSRGIKLRGEDTNVCALALEFGAASFRYSYFVHGNVTAAYEKAAVEVVVSTISRQIDGDCE